MKYYLFLFLFVSATLLFGQESLYNKNTYIVAVDKEFDPFEFENSRDKVDGFTPSLLQEIGSSASVNFKFIPMVWPDAVKALENGNVDIINMISSPERAEFYDFSQPHSQIDQALFRNENNDKIIDLASLEGHTVGFQENDISLKFLEDRTDFTKVIFKSKLDGLLKLNISEIDAFFCAEQVGISLIIKYEFKNIHLAKSHLFTQEFAFATKKGNHELIALLNKHLEKLQDLGILKSLSDKWLSKTIYEQSWIDKNQPLFFSFVGMLCAILVVFIFWSQSLQHIVHVKTKSLIENEKRFSLFMNYLPAIIFFKDNEGRTLFVNKYMDDSLGASKWMGKTTQEILHNEFGKKMNEVDKKVMELGYQKYEENILHLDGSLHHYETQKFIIERTDQTPLLGGIALDITEHKQTEKALRESNEVLNAILNSIPVRVFWKGRNLKYLGCNTPFAQDAGFYEPEDIIGKDDFELGWREQAELYRSDDSEVIMSGKSKLNIEESQTTPFGKKICVMTSKVPLRDINGDVSGILGTYQDISEIKRLRELESRANRLDTAGTIAGQVAHDFNNLLAPLIAYPEFIREELSEDHPSLKYLDQIEIAAKKIADINQQLLTLGRRGHYNQDVVNLNTIVHQAVMDMSPLPDKVTCETNLEPDLMNILGGGSQIHRVITNLLCNAVDALEDIGHICIKTDNYYADDITGVYGRVPKGEYVKLTISDTGCGISEDIAQKILDPFFTTKVSDKKRGSGLGLSVVDAVVKDHNGYLDLKTQPGKGTSFYLYFPITRKLVDDGHSVDIYGGTETILVVDDDEIQREVSTLLLKKLGYEVSSVESGEKAIEFLKENPQDLVILDMIMPGGIDGAETYKQFLKINPNQKTIIVSGFSDSSRVKEAQKLGAGSFVKKPITKKLLAMAIKTELERVKESIL